MFRTVAARAWLFLVAFVGVVAAMDYLLVDYLISHGLEMKWYPIQIASLQLSIPLVGLTFMGVLIVAIAAWLNMSATVPIAVARELGHLETIRVLRAAGIALFFFSAVLFVPYIIGASVFWGQASVLTKAVPQLAGSIQGLFYFVQPAMIQDPLTEFVISQNAAALALVAVSGLVGYSQRRIKRAR